MHKKKAPSFGRAVNPGSRTNPPGLSRFGGRPGGKKRDDFYSNGLEADREAGRPLYFFVHPFLIRYSIEITELPSFHGPLRTFSISLPAAAFLRWFFRADFARLLQRTNWPAQAPLDAVGPAGGDARAFAPVTGQPNHLYLGTTNSGVYESLDQGSSWHRLAKLDPAEGLVVDSIIVDSAHASANLCGRMETRPTSWRPVGEPRRGQEMERSGSSAGPVDFLLGAGALETQHDFCGNAGRSIFAAPMPARRGRRSAHPSRQPGDS